VGESHVSVIGVSKRFGDHLVLRDISLEIPRGAFVTLLGPSGCGKTTLLRVMAGFYEPDAGEVRFEGRRMNGVPPYARHTPMVFQDYALFPHLSVEENIGYGLRLRRLSRQEIRERCARVLRLLGLEPFAGRSPGQLSGGQQQRVALARALVLDPTIVLLDEPLSNLDARLRVEIRGEIRDLQKRLNLTVVNVTHDQEEAMAVSDLIALMHGGVLIQTGVPAELYFRPRTRFAAEFVGVANLIPGTLSGRGADGFRVETAHGPCRAEAGVDSLGAGQACLVMVRPQDLHFGQDGGGANLLSAEIVGHAFLGATIRYALKAGGLDLRVDAPAAPEGARPLGPATLRFEANRAFVVPATDS
jgi:ABC-type Fe3+/spermidine/putrescine transport system ATPase subunit